MIAKAKLNFAKVAPRKARVIANLVRGKPIVQALQILKFTNKNASGLISKLIESAVANLRQSNATANVDTLMISSIQVDKAPNSHMRRWRPRAMGRATRIQKGVSHIVVAIDYK